jgi:hypothetical protein
MSNHYGAADLRFPDDGNTIPIIDLNPYTTGISAMPPFLSVRFAWLTNGKGQLRRPQAAR